MKRFFVLSYLFCFFLMTSAVVNAQGTDFEDLTLEAESYFNGSDESGSFTSNGITFSNNFNTEYFSWDGFAYSNITDTTAEGYTAQYNAITGSGFGGSEIYTIGYFSAYSSSLPTITLKAEQIVSGAYFTNTNYSFYSMTNGDDFSKKFTATDWLKLTITGIDADGKETGTVEFKLADGTNIVDTWTWVNLKGLGAVKELTFTLSSTDVGEYGINTPTYFCMDNFNIENSSDDDNDDDDSSCFIKSIKSDSLSW